MTPKVDGKTIFNDNGLIWKWMVVVKGRGTRYETRATLNVKLYWSNTLGWVTLPE